MIAYETRKMANGEYTVAGPGCTKTKIVCEKKDDASNITAFMNIAYLEGKKAALTCAAGQIKNVMTVDADEGAGD